MGCGWLGHVDRIEERITVKGVWKAKIMLGDKGPDKLGITWSESREVAKDYKANLYTYRNLKIVNLKKRTCFRIYEFL